MPLLKGKKCLVHISNGTKEFNSSLVVHVCTCTQAVKKVKAVAYHVPEEKLLTHSVGLTVHLWKPAYERTNISAKRSIQEPPIPMQSSLSALSQHISGS